MNLIFIDFEMNLTSKEYREIYPACTGEIIEFGAVMLDENYNTISEFKEYVRPEFNDVVEKKIEKLTGISMDMLQTADSLERVLDRFVAWCGDSYVIYAWSNNDLHQLKSEMIMKDIDIDEYAELFDDWKDYQIIFQKEFYMENVMSLQKAVDFCGLEFEGRAHDRLIDARNTAFLYRCSKNSETYAKMKKAYDEAFTPTVFTMSDIFDFSKFQLQQA